MMPHGSAIRSMIDKNDAQYFNVFTKKPPTKNINIF